MKTSIKRSGKKDVNFYNNMFNEIVNSKISYCEDLTNKEIAYNLYILAFDIRKLILIECNVCNSLKKIIKKYNFAFYKNFVYKKDNHEMDYFVKNRDIDDFESLGSMLSYDKLCTKKFMENTYKYPNNRHRVIINVGDSRLWLHVCTGNVSNDKLLIVEKNTEKIIKKINRLLTKNKLYVNGIIEKANYKIEVIVNLQSSISSVGRSSDLWRV